MTVSFDVTNSGSVKGDEVPQVYVASPASPPVPMAVRALAGFERVSLDPGQTQHVTPAAAAGIGNTVFNATGLRIRKRPITPEKLLSTPGGAQPVVRGRAGQG